MSAIRRYATFSNDGTRRYTLSRVFGDAPLLPVETRGTTAPRILWIGQNPSTADHVGDDPTIRREMGFTLREWPDARAYAKVNLVDYVATDPATVPSWEDHLSREGLRTVHQEIDLADVVVLATGARRQTLRDTCITVMSMLEEGGKGRSFPVLCLGRTKTGFPRHPLYLEKTTPFEPYDIESPVTH